MKVILSGDKSEVEKVMKENSLRVNRGLVSFEIVDGKKEPANRGKQKQEPIVEGKKDPETDLKQEPIVKLKGLKE